MPGDDLNGWPVGVAGESHYQAAIARCAVGQGMALIPEPDNRFDPRAIMVMSEAGEQIGYIPRGSWVTGAMLDEGDRLHAVIASIEGRRPRRGVVLDVFHAARSDDAVAAPAPRSAPTGMGAIGRIGLMVIAGLLMVWLMRWW